MAAEIVQSVSRSNSERRYLPSRDISSIAGIILSRNLVASYNGSRKPGVGKIEDDFYCAIRADIDADIKCTRRETRDEVVSFPRLPSPKNSIVRGNIIYSNAYNGPNSSSGSQTVRCRVFFESALCILLLFNYAHATPIRKLLTINPYFISRKRA